MKHKHNTEKLVKHGVEQLLTRKQSIQEESSRNIIQIYTQLLNSFYFIYVYCVMCMYSCVLCKAVYSFFALFLFFI